jgi:deoxyribonuclease V
MNYQLHYPHPWDVDPGEAIKIQLELKARVREEPLPESPRLIAGIDMSVRGDVVQAAVVVLTYPSLELIEESTWRGPVQFPYIPGLLSFREIPPILHALQSLNTAPDLLMTDSQGRAHPRRLGLASHLGVLLDLPTIGVAKSRLVGYHSSVPEHKGAWVPLVDKDETIGAVVRTRKGVKPVYVSVGHRITLQEAIALTLACTTRYKLPEPTRLAHLLSRRTV